VELPRFIPIKEACEIFHCTRFALYKEIARGKIYAVKIANRWLIPEDEIIRLARKRGVMEQWKKDY
jgi:excisionase family DNA binding protein